jgi:hypothetical protein
MLFTAYLIKLPQSFEVLISCIVFYNQGPHAFQHPKDYHMKYVFEPCSIGTLTLKNRIIRAATHEGMTHADGKPTDDLLKTYRNLSAGGTGAIITGYVGVMQNGKTFPEHAHVRQ